MIYIALVGLTLILVRGTIFGRLQQRWAFFRCSQCVGMWVGAAAGAGKIVSLTRERVIDVVLVGCTISILSLIADALLLRLLGDPSE